MQTRKIPNEFKFVAIIPIYRAKDNTLLNNYRRVSFCPCFTNKFEKLIDMSVYYFLPQNNILYQTQYDLRPNHTSVNVMMEFYHDVLNATENKESSIRMFLELITL